MDLDGGEEGKKGRGWNWSNLRTTEITHFI